MATAPCRFCYSYKPPGFIQPKVCTPMNLSTISSQTALVNNSAQTTSSALLQTMTLQNNIQNQTNARNSTIQATVANAAMITSTLQSQLAQLQQQRYVPYQPYVPPVIPSSVMELAMKTANVGNPMPPFMKCKGSQFVTT